MAGSRTAPEPYIGVTTNGALERGLFLPRDQGAWDADAARAALPIDAEMASRRGVQPSGWPVHATMPAGTWTYGPYRPLAFSG
ncbi:hypothetical protein OG800_09610 [Streptomyces sp. NBC_00445]|uniref:hypothetical protein n=1 Tax=Streptomyces sp. NBC_00445 TaxID=2975745 RepID=UPI002E1D28D2